MGKSRKACFKKKNIVRNSEQVSFLTAPGAVHDKSIEQRQKSTQAAKKTFRHSHRPPSVKPAANRWHLRLSLSSRPATKMPTDWKILTSVANAASQAVSDADLKRDKDIFEAVWYQQDVSSSRTALSESICGTVACHHI